MLQNTAADKNKIILEKFVIKTQVKLSFVIKLNLELFKFYAKFNQNNCSKQSSIYNLTFILNTETSINATRTPVQSTGRPTSILKCDS